MPKEKNHYFKGRVIFDHQPKTAGQSVNAWLIEQLGSGCVTPNLIGGHLDLIQRYGGNFPVISGHIQFTGEGLHPLYQYITCIREPIDRAISYLFFVKNNHSLSDLGDHFEHVTRFISTDGFDLADELKPFLNDLYVTHFYNVRKSIFLSDDSKIKSVMDTLEEYHVVGLYEEMTHFVNMVSGLFGLSTQSPFPRINVTKSRPDVEQVSPRLIERLRELNSLDLHLYELLRLRLKQRQEKLVVSLPTESKYVPFEKFYFLGSDPKLFTQCGYLEKASIVSNRKAGFLVYGPYICLAAGLYEVHLSVSFNLALTGACIDVTSDKSKNCWAKLDLPAQSVGVEVALAFELTELCSDIEVRMWVPADADVEFNSLRIRSIV